MRRSIIVLIVSAVAYLAVAAAPAQSEPFYCDRVGPTIEHTDGVFDSLLALVTVENAGACGGGTDWHSWDQCEYGASAGHPDWAWWCWNHVYGWHGHNYQ